MMQARRLEIVDEYLDEGRAAVYSSHGVVVLLSELATSAWRQLGHDWVGSAVIAQQLVEEFGEPADGDAERLTEETLRSLAGMSLVELIADA